MILLMRHAEKQLYGKQWLSGQGHRQAFDYGCRLRDSGVRFDQIISSPIKRCTQTAVQVAAGLQTDIEIQISCLMGDPGIFVANDKIAVTAFEKYSVCEVINKLIKAEAIPGFHAIEVACLPLITEMQNQISDNKSVLYISHDAVIMPFIAYLNKLASIREDQIIPYLGGYIVQYATNLEKIRGALQAIQL